MIFAILIDHRDRILESFLYSEDDEMQGIHSMTFEQLQALLNKREATFRVCLMKCNFAKLKDGVFVPIEGLYLHDVLEISSEVKYGDNGHAYGLHLMTKKSTIPIIEY